MDLGDVDAVGVERAQHRRVALLEQSNQQVLCTDVVVAVIPALLLRYA